MIEKTVDAIIASRKEHSGVTQEDLKREIASLETRKYNLLKTLEDGFDSLSVRDRVGELVAQQKLLSDQLKEAVLVVDIDRDALIAKMQRDTKKLLDDPAAIKELIRE